MLHLHTEKICHGRGSEVPKVSTKIFPEPSQQKTNGMSCAQREDDSVKELIPEIFNRVRSQGRDTGIIIYLTSEWIQE